jgi:hypothetical protein
MERLEVEEGHARQESLEDQVFHESAPTALLAFSVMAEETDAMQPKEAVMPEEPKQAPSQPATELPTVLEQSEKLVVASEMQIALQPVSVAIAPVVEPEAVTMEAKPAAEPVSEKQVDNCVQSS